MHHLVLSRPGGHLCPQGIRSVTDCPSVVTSPHCMSRPSVFAFSYVPDNFCHTTLFRDSVCTVFVLEDDSYHDSLHLPLDFDQFLKLGVAKRTNMDLGHLLQEGALTMYQYGSGSLAAGRCTDYVLIWIWVTCCRKVH